MKKFSFAFGLSLIVSLSTFAGGFLTNTNQHVRFLRNPARGASTLIDAVYSNPAGLAFMEDGFHISLNNQSVFQTRNIKSTFQPFTRFGGSDTKKYNGKGSAAFVPSAFAVYKKGDWAFSGSFGVTGGGGKATFNDGLASFESIVSMIPVLSNASGSPDQGEVTKKYSVDSYMEGQQFIFGLQMGATYKINENFSVFGGMRMNFVSNSYFGYLRNIKINAPGQDMLMSAPDVFSGIAAGQSEGSDRDGVLMLANATGDKELDCDQSGWGVTPILGVDAKFGKWNIGMKYEFRSSLNVENKTKINTTGFAGYNHGINTPHDIPSLLTVGVSYEILPTLRASVGYHHFFDKNAGMADDKQKQLSGGTNEYLAGIEWDVHRIVQISGGLQRTKYGIKDGFQSDISFSLDSYSFGFGAGINLSKKLMLNIAYFWTDYEDYTKNSEAYNDMPRKLEAVGIPAAIAASAKIAGSDHFTRTNKVFAVGFDYSF